MNSPRTAREALILEALGDIDKILDRIDGFSATAEKSEKRLEATAKSLDEASDKYRMAITSFTEQAKADLTEYLDRKAIEVAAKTVEEQRAAMQEAAHMAFRSKASDEASQLGISLGQAAKEFQRSMTTRLMEHALTGLVASSFTAALVYAIVKI